MKKLKVAAVSYLNTKPLLYGIFNHELEEVIDLSLDIPAVCADKLQRGEVDFGLVPVAVIPQLDNPYIISDYCIGSVGAVKTVCIYADRPLEELTHIYLDFHSRTSVKLAQVLLEKHWQLQPELISAEEGFMDKIGGHKGAVVIGDRTIDLDKKYPFVYDLSEAWMAHTGLPFVFAAWVSRRPLDSAFIERFNAALAAGVAHIPQLVYLLQTSHPNFDLKEYFQKYISYELDAPKKKALSLFLSEIAPLQATVRESLMV